MLLPYRVPTSAAALSATTHNSIREPEIGCLPLTTAAPPVCEICNKGSPCNPPLAVDPVFSKHPSLSKGGNGMIPRGFEPGLSDQTYAIKYAYLRSPVMLSIKHGNGMTPGPLKPEGTLALMVPSPPSWQLELALSDFDGQTSPIRLTCATLHTTGVSRRLTVTNYHLSRHPSPGDQPRGASSQAL
ncbi:hypothetical protein CMEL01_16434 [Colletotrichum melonis]|uniref:Uncharacterized protein n=2 Tax=Colletotrichum acutatum species complex TaxID=2707335 RepID=A0AAI9UFN2_9PEZI|nr:hypothetical protein CMEL01_16434 [Colletotrichum melonis]